MSSKNLTEQEKHDIAIGMRPTQARKDTPNQTIPELVAKRKRIQEMQYALEDIRLENGEVELGEFDSSWSTNSMARRNQQTNRRY